MSEDSVQIALTTVCIHVAYFWHMVIKVFIFIGGMFYL